MARAGATHKSTCGPIPQCGYPGARARRGELVGTQVPGKHVCKDRGPDTNQK